MMTTIKPRIVNLVGAGSIGSFTDFLLAIMGRNIPTHLLIWDYDKVEPHNQVNQLYRSEDAECCSPISFKVDALKEILGKFSNVDILVFKDKVGEETELRGNTVVMVDSLEERRKIFKAVKYRASVPLYIDARSGGERAVVYAFDPRDIDQVLRYEKTLEGYGSPAPCANPDTIPTLFAIASVIARMLDEFTKSKVAIFTEVLINFSRIPIIQVVP